jgi:hypothetical protein
MSYLAMLIRSATTSEMTLQFVSNRYQDISQQYSVLTSSSEVLQATFHACSYESTNISELARIVARHLSAHVKGTCIISAFYPGMLSIKVNLVFLYLRRVGGFSDWTQTQLLHFYAYAIIYSETSDQISQ